jgi:very-short-patch-repair endonuclease
MPEAEKKLWRHLRSRRLGDLRFRRQHTIGPFIADFACVDARLVVELDGDQHGRDDEPDRDARRDAFIEGEGFAVLRFWNHEVADNLDGVLETIHRAAIERKKARDIGAF